MTGHILADQLHHLLDPLEPVFHPRAIVIPHSAPRLPQLARREVGLQIRLGRRVTAIRAALDHLEARPVFLRDQHLAETRERCAFDRVRYAVNTGEIGNRFGANAKSQRIFRIRRRDQNPRQHRFGMPELTLGVGGIGQGVVRVSGGSKLRFI